MRRLPVVAILLASYLCCVAIAQDESETETTEIPEPPEPELIITPGSEKDGYFTLNEGQSMSFTCLVAKGHPERPVIRPYWTKPDGERVTANSQRLEVTKLKNKAILSFVSPLPADSGKYTCKADLESGNEIEATATVRIIDKITWVGNRRVRVYEDADETINCEAVSKGYPEPEITIRPAGAIEFDDTITLDGPSKIIIKSAKPGKTVSHFNCLAVRNFDNPKATMMEFQSVDLDILSRPRFKSDETKIYGILDRNTTLPCVVDSGNPTDIKFTFYRQYEGQNEEQLENGFEDKYEIIPYTNGSMRADLMVKNLTEVDFLAQYSCRALNEVGKADLKFKLARTSAPGQMQVATVEVTDHEVIFRFTDPPGSEKDEVPITKYHVEYWRARVPFVATKEHPHENKVDYDSKKLPIDKDKPSPSNYKIQNLQHLSEYRFFIAAGNAAGFGLPADIRIHTKDRGYKAYASDAYRKTWALIPTILTLTLALLC